MTLTVLNSLTRQKEPLVPRDEATKTLTMYACGPTVYGPLHIGNARNGVVFDVVRRYIESRGWPLKFVQNVTDVDDKIIKKAKEEGQPWQEIAERYTAMFAEDWKRLRIRPADEQPRATAHIPQMLELIRKLVERKAAYAAGGDVYFSVKAHGEGYGKLSGRNPDDLLAGARVETDPRKQDPLDFALWKASKPGEPSWESPWGPGRPGWHIECSAMAMAYLGDTLDLHAGGADLLFPHHENERAQSEAATGKPFSRYWLHNGMLELKGTKMSKSLGNVTSVRDLLARFDFRVLRYFLLSAHYRSPLDYTSNSMIQAQQAVFEMTNTFWRLHELCSRTEGAAESKAVFPLESQAMLLQQRFHMAMHDDFNTAAALGHVFTLAGEAKQVIASPTFTLSPAVQQGLRTAMKVLYECVAGLGFDPEMGDFSKDVWALIREREAARRAKDFAKADGLRQQLAAQGIALEDTASGTIPLRKAAP